MSACRIAAECAFVLSASADHVSMVSLINRQVVHKQTSSFLTEDEQIKYLMGRWANQNFEALNTSWDDFLQKELWQSDVFRHFSSEGRQIEHRLYVEKNEDMDENYVRPFEELLTLVVSSSSAPNCKPDGWKDLLVAVGDFSSPGIHVPLLVKTRPIGEDGSILMQAFEYDRHWLPACDLVSSKPQVKDLSWNQKLPVAVYRGANTATKKGQRASFVRQYHNATRSDIDVGFSHLIYDYPGAESLEEFVKGNVPMEEQLRNKYIVMIEGNDVASGMKWALASNSVVFMPKPMTESAGLEGKLVKDVHYRELTWSDQKGWDLEEQLEYCINNDESCEKIAQNAREFIEHYRFCDQQYQQQLQAKILDRYCEQTDIHLA